jgi:Glycosyl hydrolases family 2, sugar binding domain/Glycosyl hydrolases family 2
MVTLTSLGVVALKCCPARYLSFFYNDRTFVFRCYFVSLSLPLQSSDTTPRLELDDGWQFLVDPSGRMSREVATQSSGWRTARVGLSWNVQFEDLRDYMGAAWYRVKFELPTFQDTRHVLLKFGAVDYFCEVFLNGLIVGSHEGGYTPFSFEVTSSVHAGPNELMVHVIDPPMDEAQNRALFPDMMYNEIPHGKQSWYIQNSGIWQGVRIEICPSLYIERLDVTPKVTGEFEVSARMAGVGMTAEDRSIARNTNLRIEIFDDSGRRVHEHSQPLEGCAHTVKISGRIQAPRLWSPETPALYVLVAELNGAIRYQRRTRFGFRSFEAKGGQLFLNGDPIFIRGALDQDFYPETIHTPTSMEYVRDLMSKAKRLGLNMLRVHLKVAHPVYLDVADEVGLLIWTELPSWSDSWFPADHFSTMAAVRTEKMFREILIRDWNHCCIVLQTIINESWGINLNDASQRDWLRMTFDEIKALLTPLGRLVVDNSPCEGNFHLKSDIEDFHQYYSMPDHLDKWKSWLADLASRPEWTFSPYGDAVRTGDEPLMVSEFGNWGLPALPEPLPWWFNVSFGERNVTRPAGVLDRLRAYKLEQVFGSYKDLAEETQRHQYESLKYEIESIRAHQDFQGYVITGMTDVHWEVNGLLDMWRREKLFTHALSTIQHSDLIACKLSSFCYHSGVPAEIEIFLSHFSDENISGAQVRWSTTSGTKGTLELQNQVRRGEVVFLTTITLPIPRVEQPTIECLEIEIRGHRGHRIAENSYDLYVLPGAVSSKAGQVFSYTEDMAELATRLHDAGFMTAASGDRSTILLTRSYDLSVHSHLQSGGPVILIADFDSILPKEWNLKVASRSGTEFDGRWFSNFNWIRWDRLPFSEIALRPILGFESTHVAPTCVIHGVPAENFDDVLSGITYGWLNNNCALAMQMRVEGTPLLLTTFCFDRYGIDPFATELLNSFIRYVPSSNCRPGIDYLTSDISS